MAKSLRPWHRRAQRGNGELQRIDPFRELGKDRPDLVEPADLRLIAHEIERRRRGDFDRPARRIEILEWYLLQTLTHEEGYSHLSAVNPSAWRSQHHLKLLRTVMSCAVILRGREKAGVVRQPRPLHQRGDELVRRQAAEGPIFGRDDHVEAASRRGDFSLADEPVQ